MLGARAGPQTLLPEAPAAQLQHPFSSGSSEGPSNPSPALAAAAAAAGSGEPLLTLTTLNLSHCTLSGSSTSADLCAALVCAAPTLQSLDLSHTSHLKLAHPLDFVGANLEPSSSQVLLELGLQGGVHTSGGGWGAVPGLGARGDVTQPALDEEGVWSNGASLLSCLTSLQRCNFAGCAWLQPGDLRGLSAAAAGRFSVGGGSGGAEGRGRDGAAFVGVSRGGGEGGLAVLSLAGCGGAVGDRGVQALAWIPTLKVSSCVFTLQLLYHPHLCSCVPALSSFPSSPAQANPGARSRHPCCAPTFSLSTSLSLSPLSFPALSLSLPPFPTPSGVRHQRV